MTTTAAYAAQSAETPLAPFSIERREPGPHDVEMDILFCGVCHSDLHTARGEWGNTRYPTVPGHEIVGRVTRTGGQVSKFEEGDLVGVGCIVDSCRTCASCREGLEQYCEPGITGTYNGRMDGQGENTYGGYSTRVVVDENYVLRIPESLDPAAAAPLLCAGITTYSPLRHWEVGPGHKVGIVGLGGLGHMGLKIAHAMGAHVVLFTTSPGKADDARRLGADEVVVSTDRDAMAAHRGTFDFILNTVAVAHNLDPFIALLKRDGALTLVGAPATPHPTPNVFGLIMGRKTLAGSMIGGIAETQEMLDFCAAHGIASDIEIIRMQDIETAYARMLKGDVKYRFVIDLESLKSAA